VIKAKPVRAEKYSLGRIAIERAMDLGLYQCRALGTMSRSFPYPLDLLRSSLLRADVVAPIHHVKPA
jgi:hypothetical protein